ncbi:hypothetical protein D3C86_1428390 [compost metagenome]
MFRILTYRQTLFNGPRTEEKRPKTQKRNNKKFQNRNKHAPIFPLIYKNYQLLGDGNKNLSTKSIEILIVS